MGYPASMAPLLLLLSCTPVMMARLREDEDRGQLGSAVQGYWKAAQWGDAPGLAPFLPVPADQLAVARSIANPVVKVTDARLLQVVVGPELVLRKDRRYQDLDVRWREGTALVQVETWGLSNQRVSTETVEQVWYLCPRGWVLDTAKSPIDADRPW